MIVSVLSFMASEEAQIENECKIEGMAVSSIADLIKRHQHFYKTQT